MRRTGHDVVVQAIIYGSLGFRASLEVTQHLRAKSLCSQLLPWLEQLGLGVRTEAFHREILASPHEGLPCEFKTEAFWRGEAAAFLGWAIHLFDKPDSTTSIDPGLLARNLRILQPNVIEILSNAILRPQFEIDDYCAFCMTVRYQFQRSVLSGDGHATLIRIHQSRLAALGLNEALQRLSRVEDEIATLASTVPSVRGLYLVRAIAAEWLLGEDG